MPEKETPWEAKPQGEPERKRKVSGPGQDKPKPGELADNPEEWREQS